MKTFRKIIFWLHLLTGTTAGLIIFTMCITGSLLAFEKQITRLAERKMRWISYHAKENRLPISELLRKFREQHSGLNPNAISIQSDPSSSAIFTIGREAVVYMNPYTGEILGTGSPSIRKFFRTITNIHRWLAINDKNRETGRKITGFCNAAFLLLAISGIYLWLPDKWTPQQLRGITWFQKKLKNRARYFNWHNVTGFWCAPVLIFITLTGLIISYQWATNLLYIFSGSEKPAVSSGVNPNRRDNNVPNQIPDNIDHLWTRVEQRVPGWFTIIFRTPAKPAPVITFLVEANESINPFARSELSLNAKTGEIVKWQSYQSLNTGRKLRIWARGLHTGEALRMPGQVVAFIATTGGAFLAFTGLSLALRRFARWRKNARLYRTRQHQSSILAK